MNLPPKEMMYDGPHEEFVSNGLEFFEHFTKMCNLQPHERMLDVGSGLGRKTIPLTKYFTTGSYEGIDCKEIGVNWCQQNITPEFPNFKFQYIDVYAPGYNQHGSIYSRDFVFPFPDESFDFVFLGSVFTHMQWDGIENYMREIRRVLKPSGRCLISWFLVDALMGDPIRQFPFYRDRMWYASKELIELAVGYLLFDVTNLYLLNQFVVNRIAWGTWHETIVPVVSYQDLILATKA